MERGWGRVATRKGVSHQGLACDQLVLGIQNPDLCNKSPRGRKLNFVSILPGPIAPHAGSCGKELHGRFHSACILQHHQMEVRNMFRFIKELVCYRNLCRRAKTQSHHRKGDKSPTLSGAAVLTRLPLGSISKHKVARDFPSTCSPLPHPLRWRNGQKEQDLSWQEAPSSAALKQTVRGLC